MLLPNNLRQNPLPPATVEFVVEDVLPRPKMELSIRDRDDDLSTHDLPLVVSIRIVFPGSVVKIATFCGVASWIERDQVFKPSLVVSMKTALVVIDKDACSDMHRVYEYQAILHTALGDEFLNLSMNRNDSPPLWDIHPEFFGQRLQVSSSNKVQLRNREKSVASQALALNTAWESILEQDRVRRDVKPVTSRQTLESSTKGLGPITRKAEIPAACPFSPIQGSQKGMAI